MPDMHFKTAILLIGLTSQSGLTVIDVWADDLPDGPTLERQGAIVGQVLLDKSNVFDLSNPDENNWLYRLANRLHIVTKDRIIENQLLFRRGDAYSTRLVDESARILRQNIYLYDADIKPVRYENGVVDISVATRDVWTLGPDLSISRSGGENRTKLGLEEDNLLGRGQMLSVSRSENVERTSVKFNFFDRNLGNSWISTSLGFADNSDGKSHRLSVVRPFYALDVRWSAGAHAVTDDRRSTNYLLGEEAAEYQHERD